MALKSITPKPVIPPSEPLGSPVVNESRAEKPAMDTSVRLPKQNSGPETGSFKPGEQAKLQGIKPISNSFMQAVSGKLAVKRTDSECGIELDAHLGVPGDLVPPPPPIRRLEGLRRDEAAVQNEVVDAVEKDPDSFAREYLGKVRSGELGATNIFAVDDAKLLFPQYNPRRGANRRRHSGTTKAAQARYNSVVHQAAAAVAKRAFLVHLDTLEPGDDVLVTNGGCAAGKSHALDNAAGEQVRGMGAVWDAAGEAGGTENKWILDECRKRGLKTTFAYVHANPFLIWGHEERGVITRAERRGRMVNALSFAQSYVLGAKNFNAFYNTYKDADDVSFIILDNRWTKPKLVDELPRDALAIDGEELYGYALEVIEARQPDEAILRGGTISRDFWGER